MGKPNWVDRSAWIAGQLATIIRTNPTYPYPGQPRRADPNNPDASLSPAHLLYMATVLEGRELDSETKACRWLGWLQAGMVRYRMATLEDMRQLNLASSTVDGRRWGGTHIRS